MTAPSGRSGGHRSNRHVIADRLGRVNAEEDRAGVLDLVAERLGVFGHDLEMFRRQPVDERQGRLERTGDDDRPVVPQLAPAILMRGSVASWRSPRTPSRARARRRR